jgi:FkbM family methyltransferase
MIPREVRNWVRSPTRSARYIGNHMLSAAGVTRSIAPRNSWNLHCHPTSFGAFQVFQRDPLQSAELDDFISMCAPGMRFIDIGAHHGFYTLAALHYGGAEARAIAIEASSVAALVLQKNIALNHLQSRVKQLNLALGDKDGSVLMLSTGPFGGDYMMIPACARADATPVKQRSLDSIVNEMQFAPTHIKIDVEGYEPEVVDGAIGTLERYHPIISFELHGPTLKLRKIDPLEVLRRLRRAGYREFTCEGKIVDVRAISSSKHNCRLVCRP